jgi:hypothetical protein
LSESVGKKQRGKESRPRGRQRKAIDSTVNEDAGKEVADSSSENELKQSPHKEPPVEEAEVKIGIDICPSNIDLVDEDHNPKLLNLNLPLNSSHKQIRRLPSARSNNLSVFNKLFYESFQLPQHGTIVVDGKCILRQLFTNIDRVSLQT